MTDAVGNDFAELGLAIVEAAKANESHALEEALENVNSGPPPTSAAEHQEEFLREYRTLVPEKVFTHIELRFMAGAGMSHIRKSKRELEEAFPGLMDKFLDLQHAEAACRKGAACAAGDETIDLREVALLILKHGAAGHHTLDVPALDTKANKLNQHLADVIVRLKASNAALDDAQVRLTASDNALEEARAALEEARAANAKDLTSTEELDAAKKRAEKLESARDTAESQRQRASAEAGRALRQMRDAQSEKAEAEAARDHLSAELLAARQNIASLENTLRSQGNLERETLELVTCLQDALSASNTSFAAAGLLQTLESGQLKAHLKIAEDNARQAFEALDKTSADQPFAEEKFTPPKSCSRARASTTAGTAFAGRGGRCSPARLWRGRT